MRKVDPKRIAIGFTEAQKRWFRERDGYRCQMHWVENGRWVRCKNTDVQIHHIIPRGWASMHYPVGFPVNGMNNGICICASCHVGKNIGITNPPHVIHIDNIIAENAYRKGDKNAYKKMFEQRLRLSEKGIPYWQTQFDMMLMRIVQKENGRFSRVKPYPKHRKYGVNGR